MNHVKKLLIFLTLITGFSIIEARRSNTRNSSSTTRSGGSVHEFANHDAMLQAISAHSSQPAIVFFHRTSCPHCQAIWPHYRALAASYGNRIYFGAINVEHPHNAHLFGHYLQHAPIQLPATPYFVLFRGGHPVQGSLPGIPREDLESFVANA